MTGISPSSPDLIAAGFGHFRTRPRLLRLLDLVLDDQHRAAVDLSLNWVVAGNQSYAPHLRADLDASGLSVEFEILDDHHVVAVGQELAVDVAHLSNFVEISKPFMAARAAFEAIFGNQRVRHRAHGAVWSGTHRPCLAERP